MSPKYFETFCSNKLAPYPHPPLGSSGGDVDAHARQTIIARMSQEPTYFAKNRSWILVSLVGVALLMVFPIGNVVGQPIRGRLSDVLFYWGFTLIAVSLIARVLKNRALPAAKSR